MVLRFVLGLVLVSGLGLVVWLEWVKETAQERTHYLDLRKDSRLAQELSLSRLLQEQEQQAAQPEQRRTVQE